MYVEGKYRNHVRLQFPRNLDEILANPTKFYDIIELDDVNLRISYDNDVKVAAMHTDEPKKNETSAMITVQCYNINDDEKQEEPVDLFVKFTGEREWPMFIRAISAACNPNHIEVEFHRQLAHRIPMPTPIFCGAKFSRTFQKSLIITKLLPRGVYRTQPDHEHCDFLQLQQMLSDVARMHSLYWNTKAIECKELEFLRSIRGYEGLENYDRPIQLFMSRAEEKWFPKLWSELLKYFKNERVCLSHGDFRPGNMLFLPRACSCDNNTNQCGEVDSHGKWIESSSVGVTSAFEPDHTSAPHVVYADWEALSIVPFMWDFTYLTILAQSPSVRRQRHRQLLQIYRENLVINGVSKDDMALAKCELHCNLLTIVLVYYSWMLTQFDAVGDVQGNSRADMDHWTDVIHTAVEDIDTDAVCEALQCDPKLVDSFVKSIQESRQEYNSSMST